MSASVGACVCVIITDKDGDLRRLTDAHCRQKAPRDRRTDSSVTHLDTRMDVA